MQPRERTSSPLPTRRPGEFPEHGDDAHENTQARRSDQTEPDFFFFFVSWEKSSKLKRFFSCVQLRFYYISLNKKSGCCARHQLRLEVVQHLLRACTRPRFFRGASPKPAPLFTHMITAVHTTLQVGGPERGRSKNFFFLLDEKESAISLAYVRIHTATAITLVKEPNPKVTWSRLVVVVGIF